MKYIYSRSEYVGVPDLLAAGKKRKSKSKFEKKQESKKVRKAAKEARSIPGLKWVCAFREVLESFKEEYRPAIQALPSQLYPTSATHGQRSFTVTLVGFGSARVEILLRQQAFKAKVNISGVALKTRSTSSASGVHEAWDKCKEFLEQDLDEQVEE